MKRVTLSTKINSLIIISIITISLAISISTNQIIEKSLLNTYEENLQNLSYSNYQYLETRYPGAWHIENDTLYKGEQRIDDLNTELDAMLSNMNIVATLFLNDTRIATNVKIDNERAIGTQASEHVSQQVLNGHTYIGLADVVNIPHLTVYTPIKDATGNVIGMWFVGQSIEKINEAIADARNILLAITVIIGLLTVIIGFILVRKIIQPIQKIRQQLAEISHGEGDLTQQLHVSTKDEIGDLALSFNQMLTTLRSMMQEISYTAEEMKVSCEDLYASTAQSTKFTDTLTNSLHTLAEGAETQRQFTAQSEHNIDSLHENIHHISQTIEQIEQSTSHTSTQAITGNEAIQEVVTQMSSIHAAVAESEKVIQQLGAQSHEIGTISDVITSIADQTDLLALNAAIEAARAGEHGKGFAVVAEEVRNLAEQSKQSAHQITALINAVQANTTTAVQMMAQGAEEVTSGIEVVAHTEHAFRSINQAIQSESVHFKQIVHLTNQIETSIQNVHNVTLKTSAIAEKSSANARYTAQDATDGLASMEEITASAKSVEQASEGLLNLINKFKF